MALTKELSSLLTVSDTFGVNSSDEFVLHVGVCHEHTHLLVSHGNQFGRIVATVDQECVTCLSHARGVLIHDAARHVSERLLGFATQQRFVDFREWKRVARRIPVELLEECTHGDFDGCGRTESATDRHRGGNEQTEWLFHGWFRTFEEERENAENVIDPLGRVNGYDVVAQIEFVRLWFADVVYLHIENEKRIVSDTPPHYRRSHLLDSVRM